MAYANLKNVWDAEGGILSSPQVCIEFSCGLNLTALADGVVFEEGFFVGAWKLLRCDQ